ncbi:MAG TPA: MFS transporter [Mycobacteriales bacterium]|nr:MFS transporter [Mycobacteriales bacterium]
MGSRADPRRLLRQHDFRHLWAADAVSQLGTRISLLAVPLLAISTLHASTLQVSLLRTAQTVAFLLLGLPAGAWCDRMRRRPVLVAADLGRAALLGSVPLAAALGLLTLGQLYAVVLCTGALTVFFDVSHQSFLPTLVTRDRLVDANATLAGNLSVAAVAGPGLAGLLVQSLTAPSALLADAVSFLVSAGWLRSIRAVEPRPERAGRPHLRREIAEGLRFVLGHPILRPIAANGAIVLFFQSAQDGISVVFLVREVHLSPGVIGLLGTFGLLGAVVAALVARRVAAVLGQARALWLLSGVNGVGFLLFPLTDGGWRLGFYLAGGLLTSFCIVVTSIIGVTFRQAACPPHLLGRANATMRFLFSGAVPLGSVIGGVLGTVVGLRPTMWIGGAGVLAATGWLIGSPLRTMRDLPTDTVSSPSPEPASDQEPNIAGRPDTLAG